MKENNKSVRNGMGLFGWLFIILFILKINPGGHLDSPVMGLSWWWVTAPIWMPIAIIVGIVLILFISSLVVKD